MTTPWQPTGDELVDSIRRASTRRRADCLGFLDEFFEMYVADHTDAEFEASWVRIVQEYPWYAEDVLSCLTSAISGRLGSVQALHLIVVLSRESTDSSEEWSRNQLARLHAQLSRVFEELSS